MTGSRAAQVVIGALLALAHVHLAAHAAAAETGPIPACRMDDQWTETIQTTASRAVAEFKAMNRALPFETLVVNPRTAAPEGALSIFVVKDASAGGVDRSGCARAPASATKESPDDLSVPGGCLVPAHARGEIRCSSAAVRAFAGADSASRPASPALLYIIAHELAHLHQGRRGEFAGKIERISLSQPRPEKLTQLRRACQPGLVTKEEEADAIALDVLTRTLPTAPYREPTWTERGSMYWNIDRIRLSAAAWERIQHRDLRADGIKLHPSFVPAELPMPAAKVTSASRRFVCDLLTRNAGDLHYPARQTTHPAPEQRLSRL